MSITIGIRGVATFFAGVAAAVVALLVFQAVTADAVGSDESTFVPIEPCRLFDTRPGEFNVGTRSTPLGGDEAHLFQVTGSNGNCTIPTAATAVSINLTAVGATEATNIRLYPADVDTPLTASLNVRPGDGPTPNKVDVDLSSNGRLAVYNRFGSVHVVGDVMGYYRHDGLGDLDARLADLETLTASMSLETVDGQPVVRFAGVNVQVVNGSGSTLGPVNGLGNLIVGYNENGGVDVRTGSHNLVVGDRNSYSGSAGAVIGRFNEISSQNAVALGTSNTATGVGATVSGGLGNEAAASYSTVTGGSGNVVLDQYSTVSGGFENTADGRYAAVSGGSFNTTNENFASISGGRENIASGFGSSLLGGRNNIVNGMFETIAGGDNQVCIVNTTTNPSSEQAVVCGEGTIAAAD